MPTNSLTARIRAIKLLEFKYDRTFKAVENTPIQFNVQVKHRIPDNSTRLEILATITYSEKGTERTEPLVSTECITVYQLEGVEVEIDKDSGKEIVSIPEELMHRLIGESIAHARALLAAHTAGTVFGGTHIEIKTDFPVNNKVEL